MLEELRRCRKVIIGILVAYKTSFTKEEAATLNHAQRDLGLVIRSVEKRYESNTSGEF